jgi:hypothetical protein
MKAIKATVKAGRVEVQVPAEWAEGTQVEILPQSAGGGFLEDDSALSPEEIARTLAAMDKVEPFDITDDESAKLEAWQRKVREYSIDNIDKGIEDVFR